MAKAGCDEPNDFVVNVPDIWNQPILQSVREISVITVTDDYLCYKEPKNPYNFFLFYLTN